MNFSGSGISWTLGPRGASIGVSKRGTYLNTGIPGTGFYSREKIGGSKASQKHHALSKTMSISISISVSDDGTISYKDSSGQELPDHLINVVKRQQGELIRDLIKQKCDEINKEIESVGNLHLFTPSPKARPLYVPRQFEVDKPRSPILQKPGLFSSLFKSLRDKIEDLNRVSLAIYDHQLKGWKVQFAAFQEYERRRKELIETKIYSELPAMQQFLDDTLQGIVWPRETLAFSKIYAEGRVVFIEVDLPEIENMPNKMASIPSKGYKLTVKELSSANIHKLYMQHVHAIAFRTIGEAFRSLPKAQMIILSAFSHRPDKTNGRITKDYLLSVRVLRKSWGA